MRERRESVRSRPWRSLPRNGGTLRYAIVVALFVADAAVVALVVVALTATAATDLKCDATCSAAMPQRHLKVSEGQGPHLSSNGYGPSPTWPGQGLCNCIWFIFSFISGHASPVAATSNCCCCCSGCRQQQTRV